MKEKRNKCICRKLQFFKQRYLIAFYNNNETFPMRQNNILTKISVQANFENKIIIFFLGICRFLSERIIQNSYILAPKAPLENVRVGHSKWMS